MGFIRMLRTSSQVVAACEVPDIPNKPLNQRNAGTGTECVFRTNGTGFPPHDRAVVLCRLVAPRTRKPSTTTGKQTSSWSVGLCGRATRSNEGEGRVFRQESRPFRFASPSLCSENAPPLSRDLRCQVRFSRKSPISWRTTWRRSTAPASCSWTRRPTCSITGRCNPVTPILRTLPHRRSTP
jgi:hypothetical protein